MWLFEFGWFLLGFCVGSFAVICCWMVISLMVLAVSGFGCCVIVVFCSCVCCLGFDLVLLVVLFGVLLGC